MLKKFPESVMKTLVVISLSLCLAAGLAAASRAENGPKVPAFQASTSVKLVAFTPAGANARPSFSGRVDAGDTAMLAFRVAGQVQDFKIQMGDRVKQGDVLAELDPTDYRLNVEARQAEFDLAQLGAERSDALYQKKLISEDQFDTARTLLATNRAKLDQAKEQLSYCSLKAPFDGNIAFTYAMPSEVVGPQVPVINLQDTRKLEISFNLPPRFQPLLRDDEPATFLVSHELQYDVQLQAEFKEVGMRPDPDTNSYPVTLTLPGREDLGMWPGMPVQVELQHPSLFSGRWAPPAEALFGRKENTAFVWKVNQESLTVNRVQIEVDAAGALLNGLTPGDRIVAAGVDRLVEGQKVRAWVREGGL